MRYVTHDNDGIGIMIQQFYNTRYTARQSSISIDICVTGGEKTAPKKKELCIYSNQITFTVTSRY